MTHSGQPDINHWSIHSRCYARISRWRTRWVWTFGALMVSVVVIIAMAVARI